jgi:hypothetical protein
MELEAVKEKIRASKLHPVQVVDDLFGESARGHRFIGSLEEYLDALRAVGALAVFIRATEFDEEDFFHAPEDEGNLPASESEYIDLRSVVPELRAFEKHRDTIAMYKLSGALAADSLNFVISEPWWMEFLKLRATATDQVDGDRAASEAKSKADREAQDRKALAALGGLMKDANFARLPTQKAMLAYALDRIPELQNVDELLIKVEIQDLNAKIRAKGLDRKRQGGST